MDKALVFGADGGGTKTLGVIATAEGQEISRHIVGAGNPNVAGVDVAARNLHELVVTCCGNAGCSPRDLRSIVFGLAGVGSDAIREKLQNTLTVLLGGEGVDERAIAIETDARIGLEGAFGGKSGVVMIAGTGSILIGKSSTEEVVRVGGWGRILGDEGSGYWIGVEAIKAVARDLDGGPRAQVLRNMLAQRFGLAARAEILDAVYQKKFEIPSIAPVVLEGAGAGDPACTAILHQGAQHLAAHLSALVEKLGEADPVGIVFVGGLIDHDTSYSRILRDTITRTVPRADVRQALHSPAWGAVIMAMKKRK